MGSGCRECVCVCGRGEGGGWWSKMPKRSEGLKVCRISFYRALCIHELAH